MPRADGTADAFGDSGRDLARLRDVTRAVLSRPAVVALSAVMATAAVATACSPFGSANADDAGTLPEGGSPEGGSPEGGSPEGGSTVDASARCVPDGCVDFEAQTWPNTWKVQGDPASVAVTVGPSTSGMYALDFKFQSKAAFLAIDVSHMTSVTVRANVDVLQFGDGEVDMFGISESPVVGASGFHLVHKVSKLATLAVELGAGGAQQDLKSSFLGYTSVMFHYDAASNTYSYRVGSEPLQSGVLGGAVSASNMAVTIGPSASSGVTAPWHVRFDDVEITTTP